MKDTLPYLSSVFSGMVAVWFTFWPYRRKFELDIKLDRTEQILRWSVIAIGFVAMSFRSPQYKWLRITALIVASAFFAWPNYGHHFATLLRRLGLLRLAATNGPAPREYSEHDRP